MLDNAILGGALVFVVVILLIGLVARVQQREAV